MLKVVGIKFNEWSKVYSFDPNDIDLKERDKIIVETGEGLAFGTVKAVPREISGNESSDVFKKVVRKANEEDLMQIERNREKENTAFCLCQEKISEMGLQMKLVSAEYLFDGSKATFHFTAEERVDFRELVKELASRLHTRIELRQIGVRDEARIKGGIGPCGRILCCSSWIDNFAPVSVKMAKRQGLSLNPSNISGMCGRLMCCLAYEYQNYLDGTMQQSSRERVIAKEKAEKTAYSPAAPEQVRTKEMQSDEISKPESVKETEISKQETATPEKTTATGEKKKWKKRRSRYRGKKKTKGSNE